MELSPEEIITRWENGDYNTPNGKELLFMDLTDLVQTAKNEGHDEAYEIEYGLEL